jgi:hypothetical protein
MRRKLRRQAAQTLLQNHGHERIAAGWRRHNAGLASCNRDLDQLLEDMCLIPPKTRPVLRPPQPIYIVLQEPADDFDAGLWVAIGAAVLLAFLSFTSLIVL